MAKKQRRNRREEEKDTSKAAGGPGDGSTGKKEKPPKRNGENALVEWIKSGVVALILFIIIRSFLFNTFVIISGSMENTLLVGDLLLVNRAAVGSFIPGTSLRIPGYSHLHRGDILVFDPPHEEDMKLVKRLMGLPGDTLEMRDKVLYVNGQALQEDYVRHTPDQADDTHPWMVWQEQYLLHSEDKATYRPTRDNWGPLVIPPGHYFMMGDNRDTSLDSRYWGLLERWRVEGRALLVYFSYDRESPRPFPWLRDIRWGRIGDVVH
jgi:signal peptidase I